MADQVSIDPDALRPVIDGLAEVRESLIGSLYRVAAGMSVGSEAWGDDSFGSEFADGPEGFVAVVDNVVAGVQAVADAVLSIGEGLAEAAALHTENEEFSAESLSAAVGGAIGAGGGGLALAGSPSIPGPGPSPVPERDVPRSGGGSGSPSATGVPAGSSAAPGADGWEQDAGAEEAVDEQRSSQPDDAGGVTPSSASANTGWIESTPSGPSGETTIHPTRPLEVPGPGATGTGPAGGSGGSGSPGGGARSAAKPRKRPRPANPEDSAANPDGSANPESSAAEVISSSASEPGAGGLPTPAAGIPADSSRRGDRKAETTDQDESGRSAPLQAAPSRRTTLPDSAT